MEGTYTLGVPSFPKEADEAGYHGSTEETSETTAWSWETLNTMLKEVKGDDSVYFNPYMFITDEAGANANGITKVFGKDGNDKSRTWQFHFKQALHIMLAKFPKKSRDIKHKGRV